MKKVVSFFVTVIIILLYCFASGTINRGLSNSPSIHESDADLEEEGYYLAVSVNYLGSALQAETVTSIFNAPTFFSFKNSLYGYAALLKFADNLFSIKFNQYISFSGNFTVKYRKSDLIFPFHYFW